MKTNMVRPMSLENIKKVIENEKAQAEGRPMVLLYPKKEGSDCTEKVVSTDSLQVPVTKASVPGRKAAEIGQVDSERDGLRFFERFPEKSEEQLVRMLLNNM